MANNVQSPFYGNQTVGTTADFFAQNAATRPSSLGGKTMSNGLLNYPRDLNQGIQQDYANSKILSKVFVAQFESLPKNSFRSLYEKKIIPKYHNSLSMTFNKMTELDTDPTRAGIDNIMGWNPSWNEVSAEIFSVEITTNAYGHFVKKNRMFEQISALPIYEEIDRRFTQNAQKVMENLATIRAYEGANKLFVKSVAAFNPANPHAPRITLGASAADVGAPLTWSALEEAQHLMRSNKTEYTIVDPTTGSKSIGYRTAPVKGYEGENYLVYVSNNGYNQLLKDPQVNEKFIINGGAFQTQAAAREFGITSAVNGFKFRIVDTPLTISKQATPQVKTDGQQELEVCFVLGNGDGQGFLGVELSFEGETKLVNVGYADDPKIDPFQTFGMTGWYSITDFGVVYNEALYAIPHTKSHNVISGNSIRGSAPIWKK